jgi:hypothetical protein
MVMHNGGVLEYCVRHLGFLVPQVPERGPLTAIGGETSLDLILV